MYSRADRLLRQFSLKLNADSIAFDENRLCSFIIDNRYRILLTSTNSEYIMIYGFAEDLRIIIILLLNFSMLIYGLQRIMDHICVMIITHNHYYWLNFSLNESSVEKLECEIEVVIRSMENLYHILQDKGITLDTDYT